jgi:hypothetical protein
LLVHVARAVDEGRSLCPARYCDLVDVVAALGVSRLEHADHEGAHGHIAAQATRGDVPHVLERLEDALALIGRIRPAARRQTVGSEQGHDGLVRVRPSPRAGVVDRTLERRDGGRQPLGYLHFQSLVHGGEILRHRADLHGRRGVGVRITRRCVGARAIEVRAQAQVASASGRWRAWQQLTGDRVLWIGTRAETKGQAGVGSGAARTIVARNTERDLVACAARLQKTGSAIGDSIAIRVGAAVGLDATIETGAGLGAWKELEADLQIAVARFNQEPADGSRHRVPLGAQGARRFEHGARTVEHHVHRDLAPLGRGRLRQARRIDGWGRVALDEARRRRGVGQARRIVG